MTMTYYDEASTDPNVRLAAYKLRLKEEERKAQLRESEAMGRAEERLATARKMRARGFSVQDIEELTGLTLADLERADATGEAQPS